MRRTDRICKKHFFLPLGRSSAQCNLFIILKNMNDKLLSNYDKQLNFIREIGRDFSQSYTKIAGRIDSADINVADPHIARLREAFALLNARIDCKLDKDLSFFNSALLNNIHPQYQTSIPSMAIVQINPEVESLEINRELSRGTLLVSDSGYGNQCYFTTCYPVVFNPVKTLNVKLRDKILTFSVKFLFKKVPNKLRFYINAPLRIAESIYELLFDSVVDIDLKHATLHPVGFEKDQGILPNNARVFFGNNFLVDYFILPEKFLFFDLCLPNLNVDELEINIKLNKANEDLEKNITSKNFLLNCTPIINIYPQMAEPIVLSYLQVENQLIPDIKNPPHAVKVYSIKSVKAKNESGKVLNYQPFYGNKYNSQLQPDNYWYLTQKNNKYFLALTNTVKNFHLHEKVTIESELLCTNGDMPMCLPYSTGEPKLYLSKAKAICLTPFTRNYHVSNLQLITHLLKNYLFFSNHDDNLDYLIKIISLYDFANKNHLKDAFLNLTTKTIKKSIQTNTKYNVDLPGTEINLEVDPSKFSGINLFLFGSVLNKFFSQYCEMNSFTELVLSTKQRGEIYRFA